MLLLINQLFCLIKFSIFKHGHPAKEFLLRSHWRGHCASCDTKSHIKLFNPHETFLHANTHTRIYTTHIIYTKLLSLVAKTRLLSSQCDNNIAIANGSNLTSSFFLGWECEMQWFRYKLVLFVFKIFGRFNYEPRVDQIKIWPRAYLNNGLSTEREKNQLNDQQRPLLTLIVVLDECFVLPKKKKWVKIK